VLSAVAIPYISFVLRLFPTSDSEYEYEEFECGLEDEVEVLDRGRAYELEEFDCDLELEERDCDPEELIGDLCCG